MAEGTPKKIEDTIKSASKTLHERQTVMGVATIYCLYGLADGWSNAYSNISLLANFLSYQHQDDSKAANNKLDGWVHGPYLIGVWLFSGFIILLSLFANIWNKNSKNKLHENLFKWSNVIWIYLRHLGKGLKNSYKGIATLFSIISVIQRRIYKTISEQKGLITSRFFMTYILGIGLALGALSIISRVYMQRLIDKRKEYNSDMEKLQESLFNNPQFDMADLLTKLTELGVQYDQGWLSDEERQLIGAKAGELAESEEVKNIRLDNVLNNEEKNIAIQKFITQELRKYFQQIKLKPWIDELKAMLPAEKEAINTAITKQEAFVKYRHIGAKILSSYNGLIEGAYKFLGTITLVSLWPAAFITFLVLSISFTFLNVLNAFYEEKLFQIKLKMNQDKLRQKLQFKELELAVKEHEYKSILGQYITAEDCKREYDSLIEKYESLENDVDGTNKEADLSRAWFIVDGIRNGLYFFNIFSSLIYATYAVIKTFFAASVFANAVFLPYFIIASLAVGTIGLLGFIGYSCVASKHLKPLEAGDQQKAIPVRGHNPEDEEVSLLGNDSKPLQEMRKKGFKTYIQPYERPWDPRQYESRLASAQNHVSKASDEFEIITSNPFSTKKEEKNSLFNNLIMDPTSDTALIQVSEGIRGAHTAVAKPQKVMRTIGQTLEGIANVFVSIFLIIVYCVVYFLRAIAYKIGRSEAEKAKKEGIPPNNLEGSEAKPQDEPKAAPPLANKNDLSGNANPGMSTGAINKQLSNAHDDLAPSLLNNNGKLLPKPNRNCNSASDNPPQYTQEGYASYTNPPQPIDKKGAALLGKHGSFRSAVGNKISTDFSPVSNTPVSKTQE